MLLGRSCPGKMSIMTNLTFKTKMLSGYGFIFTLMDIVTCIVVVSVKAKQNNFIWVDHTHKVLDKA